jgi:exosortase/archaeosortase family protein
MEKNLKTFMIKGAVLIALLFGVTFLFRFFIDFLNIGLLSMNNATRLFSKSDALKILALTVLFFGLYYKEKIIKISHDKQPKVASILFGTAGFFAVAFYYYLRYIANVYGIESGRSMILIQIASMITLVIAFALFLVAAFSFSYLKKFYHELKKPLLITSGIAIAAYFLMMWFQSLWPLFTNSITRILYALFNPLYPTYVEMGRAPLLDVNGFVVSIGAPCSGIESIFLFAAFSIGIYVLDHQRLQKRKFLIASLIGIVGIYFVNILRLFLLILTGIYISPDFAVGMFHSNVGWILFALYFLCYYYLIRKFIYLKKSHKQK